MFTFHEYIDWVRETEPLLDMAFNPCMNTDNWAHYGEEQGKILGRYRSIHPSNDNGKFLLDVEEMLLLKTLLDIGWTLTGADQNRLVAPIRRSTEDKHSDIHKLEYAKGVMSGQLWSDQAAMLVFRERRRRQPFALQYDQADADYHFQQGEIGRHPLGSFEVRAVLAINPYGHYPSEIKNRRDRDSVMAESVLGIMEAAIRHDIHGTYSTYGMPPCVANVQ